MQLNTLSFIGIFNSDTNTGSRERKRERKEVREGRTNRGTNRSWPEKSANVILYPNK